MRRKSPQISHADYPGRSETNDVNPIFRNDKSGELINRRDIIRSPSVISLLDAQGQAVQQEETVVVQSKRLEISKKNRADSIRKSADLGEDDSDQQSIVSSKSKGKGVDQGNQLPLAGYLGGKVDSSPRNLRRDLPLLFVNIDSNSVKFASKSAPAPSKVLTSIEAIEMPRPKSTRVRDITPPQIPVASTSRQNPINSKVTAPKPPRKLAEDLVRKLSDATTKSTTTTIPRSSGNHSKSKYILPHKPISKGKNSARNVPLDERMEVDDESPESENEVLHEDEEIQSVLADLVEVSSI